MTKYRAHALEIGWGWETTSRGRGGDLWGGGAVVVEEVGCGEPKNERRRGFDPPRLNIERIGSVLIGAGDREVVGVEAVCGMGWIR